MRQATVRIEDKAYLAFLYEESEESALPMRSVTAYDIVCITGCSGGNIAIERALPDRHDMRYMLRISGANAEEGIRREGEPVSGGATGALTRIKMFNRMVISGIAVPDEQDGWPVYLDDSVRGYGVGAPGRENGLVIGKCVRGTHRVDEASSLGAWIIDVGRI